MATTFLESGSAATQGLEFYSIASGSVSSDGSAVPGRTRTIKCITDGVSNSRVRTPNGAIQDSGTRISVYIYLPSVTPAATDFIMFLGNANDIADIMQVSLQTNGKLLLDFLGGGTVSGTTVLSTNTLTRIDLSYTITSTTVNEWRLYVNGVLEITASNKTLPAITSSQIGFGVGFKTGANFTAYYSDMYADNSSALTDTGNIRVTAKRPFANGTTNGFTTQIGSGGSGYGSGHAPQVNERPLSATNGWSMIGAGGAITEEYTIEGASVGDVDLTGATILDFGSWAYASSLVNETGQIIIAGATSNIALTNTNTMFTAFSGSTTYPSGGNAVGIITTTALTTVSLYECGTLVAFIPVSGDTPAGFSGRMARVGYPPAARYYFNQDTSRANPEMAQPWVGKRMWQTPVPRALLDLLYLYAWDTGRSNPEQALGWKPTPIRQYPLPRLTRYLYWNTAHDTSFSNPSSPQSWVPQKINQPYVRPKLFYTQGGDTSQSNDNAGQPITVIVFPTRAIPAARLNLYYWNSATEESNVETPLSWTPKPLRVPKPPLASWLSLYLWNEESDTSNDEMPQSWVPKPLRVPQVPLAAKLNLYQSAEDSGQTNVEGPLSWVPKPLWIPKVPLAAKLNLYQSAEDSGQTNDETPLSWAPRPLWSVYRRPTLFYTQHTDTSASNAEGGLSWQPRPLWQIERVRPWMYWTLDTSQDTGESNVEAPPSWTPRPLPRQRLTPRTLYTLSTDTGIQSEDTPPWWAPRTVRLAPAPRTALYFSEGITPEVVTTTEFSWVPRALHQFSLPLFWRALYTWNPGGGAVTPTRPAFMMRSIPRYTRRTRTL